MQRMIIWLLWAALLATLAGTIANTTWAFATVNGGTLALGALQAAAADLGLVALAATLAVRRSQGERARWLWCAVAGFVVVSTYASYLHSYAQATPLDAPGAALRPLLLGAFLPLMLFALVEVVSHARKPATAAQPSAQPAEEPAEASQLTTQEVFAGAWKCAACPKTFTTQQALAAHARAHKGVAVVATNGH